MKIVLSLLFLVSYTIGGFSQSFIDKYYQNLVEDDNSTVVSVSGEMFRYAAVLVDESNDDDLQTKEVLSGIKSLQFVGLEEAVNPEVEYQKGLRTIPDRMNEMVSVKSKGSKLKVFLDEEDETVYEIVALGIKEESFFVGSILCEIKLEDVNEFLSQIQSQDNKAFKQLWDVEYDDLNVYPNPISANSKLTIEIPKAMNGGKGTLSDSSGKAIKTISLTDQDQELDIENLSPGNYILTVSHNGIQLQKKVIIVK